jgi:hypothetical protein
MLQLQTPMRRIELWRRLLAELSAASVILAHPD